MSKPNKKSPDEQETCIVPSANRRAKTVDAFKLNLQASNLDQLSELLAKAAKQAKQLSATLDEINNFKVTVKTQVDD